MTIWYILWSFWYNLPRFGMLYQEKSGNRALAGPVTHLEVVNVECRLSGGNEKS
jgi:hypothetical protein